MKPPRPNRIVFKDPESQRRFEVVLNVDVYRVYPLDPRSPHEVALAEEKGPMIRVLYCRRTYDMAMARVDELLAQGHPEDRFEFVLAERDELSAVRRGDMKLIPLADEE